LKERKILRPDESFMLWVKVDRKSHFKFLIKFYATYVFSCCDSLDISILYLQNRKLNFPSDGVILNIPPKFSPFSAKVTSAYVFLLTFVI